MSHSQQTVETPYEDLLRQVMEQGVDKNDRTGTGTRSVFGRQIRYDLSKGFPLLTTKKVNFKWVLVELLWFLRGDTNIRFLLQHGVSIWTEWPLKDYLKRTRQQVPEQGSEEWELKIRQFGQRILKDDAFAHQFGNIGQVYGAQWRAWPTTSGETIDQIAKVIEQIKQNPDSRRLVVTAWNPEFVDESLLPPCHALFQFYVANGKLSCQLYQRSADLFLGVPFNIASYALLTMMVAQQCNLELGEFIWSGGDTHVYSNHFDQVNEQLGNEPRPYPTLKITRTPGDISSYEVQDFELINYRPHKYISAPVAV